MSRIGRSPVPIPQGVTVAQKGSTVEVKGPQGVLATAIPAQIQVEIAEGELRLRRGDESKQTRSLHGLTRALVANMMTGVTAGFAKQLEIHGVGYRAEVSGKVLKLALGFSHPVEVAIPAGLKVSVAENRINVEGADRQLVGQFASDIRELRPPEPYKGKGVRYVNEHVRRKVGKAGAA